MNGWRFGHNPSNDGQRRMAASFANLNGGVIQAVDPFAIGFYTGSSCAASAVDPSYLLISATNIVSGGGIGSSGSSLSVGLNGLMNLVGHNVDLSHSSLEVLPAWKESQSTATDGTNFVPDIGFYDIYWAQSAYNDDYGLDARGLWDGSVARSEEIPTEQGAFPFPPGSGIPAFSILNPTADSYVYGELISVTVTNIIGSPTNVSLTNIVVSTVQLLSNVVKGAVFVGAPPEFGVEIGFSSSDQFLNRFDDASVLIYTGITNAVTGQTDFAGVFFGDQLASDTRLRGNALNVLYCSSPQTFRPAPYSISRDFSDLGFPGNNGYPDPNFLMNSGNFDPNILFDIATNRFIDEGEFAAYSSYVDNLASRLSAVPNATRTNLPGRIIISADNLNLDHTRIRGEGRIQIDTPQLISSTNAIIDCETLAFSLGSKTQRLNVQSLVPPNETVSRLKGNVRTWSAVWSNQVTVILENYSLSNVVTDIVLTNGGVTVTNSLTNIVAVLSPITNVLGVGYHALMVDGSLLSSIAPVYVESLRTRTADVTINDSMTLLEGLLIDGRSLTLNASFRLAGVHPPNPLTGAVPPTPVLRNWVAMNAPNLLFLTNNGIFSIPNEAHFGDDRPPYATFINNGSLSAFGINVDSDYFENSGTITARAGLFLRGGTATLQNGQSFATSISLFEFNQLRFFNYELDGGVGPLRLSVTNSLSDSGPGSGNVFRLRDGFHLLIKPTSGDLLGTTIESSALLGSLVRHTWAGEDRGPSPAGFSNNVAIGRLVLIPGSSSAKLNFSGTGPRNGLYVDLLDLSAFNSADALLSQLQINPSLVIYFAAADLGFTPPDVGGIAQQPEEYLNGLFNGRLRWVPAYAGANSGQAVLVNGQPTQINKALFNSQLLDSDNDGIPNGSDGGPDILLSAPITIEVFGNGTVTPNYNGTPLLLGQVYSVTATPAKGAVFTGWSGTFENTSPMLLFTNTGDIVLTANFAFQTTPGTYSGLFYDPLGIEMFESGLFTARVTKNGSLSGTVQMGRERFGFSGRVDENGFVSPGGAFLMDLQFDSDRIVGTISDGEWIADLVAEHSTFGKTNRVPFAGRYTMVFRGSGVSTNPLLPFGDGYGTALVDSRGKVKFSGMLADGTKISQSTVISASGQWPFYVPLYRGAGQILGWMSAVETAAQDLGGSFSWIKEPNPEAKYYPEGFKFLSDAIGSRYTSAIRPATGFTSGFLTLSGGDFAEQISRDFLISSNNRVTLSSNKTSLTISAGSGLFKGSVVNPATGKPTRFNGAILQKQNFGAGYFLGTNQSGKVLIAP